MTELTETRTISPEAILMALSLANGSIRVAAVALGVSRATLYRWVAANPQIQAKITPRKPGKPAKLPFRVVWTPCLKRPTATWPNRDIAETELARQGCTIEPRTGKIRDANGRNVGRGRSLTVASVDAPETGGAA